MSNADISPESVPPTEEDTGSWWRSRRRLLYWGGGLVLLVGFILGALFVPTPYVLLGPGSVRSAEDRVEISGAETFSDDTDVLFTTVHIEDATLFGLLRGNLDDAMKISTRDEMFPQGRDETREINQHAMDFSKLIATREALLALGADAEYSADGALVVDVVDDGPADGVLKQGDVIVAVDGETVNLPTELTEPLSKKEVGTPVQLTIERRSMAEGESASDSVETLSETVVLGASEDDPTRPILGINVQPLSPRVESSVNVEVDSGKVTGPSAGLAWSLAVVDRLTEGSLTGDRDVAVTGEILPGGEIGQIGGIAQKVATVKRNGVDVFLYPASTPASEVTEMERIADGEVELVPVATLSEALDFLDPDGSVRASSSI